MKESPHLVLASGSPRRREILTRLGLRAKVMVPDIPENRLDGENPSDYVRRIAAEKARAISSILDERTSHLWILGADTTVVIDGTPLGKPDNDAHAREMLAALNGRSHEVLTGWTLYHGDQGIERTGVEITRVWFRNLTAGEIEAYIATGEGRDKAGSYAIQGIGCFLIDRIEGNYENVVGLPAAPLIEALLALGVVERFPVDGRSIG